jgi:hypothetical protein
VRKRIRTLSESGKRKDPAISGYFSQRPELPKTVNADLELEEDGGGAIKDG